MQVVLASGNQGKLTELQRLLAPLGLDVVTQQSLGINGAEEPFATFVENALTKARHASQASQLPAIADDSGLVVPSLGGAPGVHSARFAGEDATDDANNQKLITQLFDSSGRPTAPVNAHFYCALVFVTAADDPAPVIATARWFGEIQYQPSGNNGFGYDPHFFVPTLQLTSAQLPAADKNRLSHRGQASAKLLPQLSELLG